LFFDVKTNEPARNKAGGVHSSSAPLGSASLGSTPLGSTPLTTAHHGAPQRTTAA